MSFMTDRFYVQHSWTLIDSELLNKQARVYMDELAKENEEFSAVWNRIFQNLKFGIYPRIEPANEQSIRIMAFMLIRCKNQPMIVPIFIEDPDTDERLGQRGMISHVLIPLSVMKDEESGRFSEDPIDIHFNDSGSKDWMSRIPKAVGRISMQHNEYQVACDNNIDPYAIKAGVTLRDDCQVVACFYVHDNDR